MSSPKFLGLRNSWDAIPKGAPPSEIGRLTAPVKWAKPSVPKMHKHRGRRALPDLRAARGDIHPSLEAR